MVYDFKIRAYLIFLLLPLSSFFVTFLIYNSQDSPSSTSSPLLSVSFFLSLSLAVLSFLSVSSVSSVSSLLSVSFLPLLIDLLIFSFFFQPAPYRSPHFVSVFAVLALSIGEC